jgi:hypothetical protein
MCINFCFKQSNKRKKIVKFNDNDKIYYYKHSYPLPVKILHMANCTVVVENKPFSYDSDDNFYLFI